MVQDTLGRVRTPRQKREQILDEYERSGMSNGFCRLGRGEVYDAVLVNLAVGKKKTNNWIFIGHAECNQRGAILFTIIQACRRLGINPFDYIMDVLTNPTRSDHSDRRLGLSS